MPLDLLYFPLFCHYGISAVICPQGAACISGAMLAVTTLQDTHTAQQGHEPSQ